MEKEGFSCDVNLPLTSATFNSYKVPYVITDVRTRAYGQIKDYCTHTYIVLNARIDHMLSF